MSSRKTQQLMKRNVSRARFMLTLALSALLTSSSLIFSRSYFPKARTIKFDAPNTVSTPQQGARVTAPAMPEHVDAPHTLAATYYSLTDGLNSILMLSNQGPHPMEIHVTLFSPAGERFDVPPVVLEGNTVRGYNLREWAAAKGEQFRQGSLQVGYSGKEMELGGVLKMFDPDRSLIFDEELTEPTKMFASSRLEGVWWLLSNRAEMRLALSNTTDSVLSVTASVEGTAPRSKHLEALTLQPHETYAVSVRDLVGRQGKTLQEVGGVSIQHSGPPGALLARALIQEPAAGYSSVVEFSDPKTAKSSKLNGVGLRVGRVTGEELRQVAVARNIGNTSTVLTGRIPYAASDGSSGSISIPETRLNPGETKEINLARAVQREGLRSIRVAGLEFDYAGAPGSIVMSALSVSSSGNQVFRVPMIDAGAQHSSSGKYPWSIEGSSSTIIYLKNASDQPRQYTLQISFVGGLYTLGMKTIEAGQVAAFDIRKLRNGQAADVNGKTIPLDATGGQVTWSVYGSENRVLLGRAEQVDLLHGMSMTSACPTCCPNSFSDGWVDPGSVGGLVGDFTTFLAWERDVDCYGNYQAPFAPPASFDSSDPTVATCDSSGNANAVGPGTTRINAFWFAPAWYQLYEECEYSPVNADPFAGCTVDTLVVIVPNPPFDDDNGNPGIIAGEPFTMMVQAIKPDGQKDILNNSLVTFSPSRRLDSSEIAFPSSFRLQDGEFDSGVLLNRVNGTETDTTFRFKPVNDTHTEDRLLYTYFAVIASREGLVGGTTACGHVIQNNDHFVALPSTGMCGTAVKVRRGSHTATTTVRDVGPWFPNSSATTGNPCVGDNDPYWNTGGVPRVVGMDCDSDNAGIDLADGTFSDMGLTGNGTVWWRFN